ncbi:toll/interleukin-1 receptor domain-containing protein [Ilumatobacter sp.]|uniref:toll/interleukin-1 receptor domain-containing protein n=1 Tax=Ilumatobacter sp. TaxID=1967498 RepID=UPI003AF78A7C
MSEKIFISYRRSDSEADAGRLYADLVQRYGPGRVFKDIDSIPLGASVRDYIDDAISTAGVALVLIGPEWLSGDRLGQPDDWVRIEIESALSLGVPIIPICLRRARFPLEAELPASISALADHNAAEIEHSSWNRDLIPICDGIESLLESNATSSDNAGPSAIDPTRPTSIRIRLRRLAVPTAALALALGATLAVLLIRSLDDESPGSVATVSDTSSRTTITEPSSEATDADVASSFETILISLNSDQVEVFAPATIRDQTYIEFPEPESGDVRVEFTPNQPGPYVVWARIRIAPGATQPVDSNSLYVSPGALVRTERTVWDFWENRVLPEPGEWEWDRISRRGDGTAEVHEENPFVIQAGVGVRASFTLGGREPGVGVEQVLVTNDPDWQPVDCSTSQVCMTRLAE